jgi:inhibitor of cysteine peptidase
MDLYPDCHALHHHGGNMPGIVLGQADKGKLIEIKCGQTISIHLAESPTTGYQWEVDSTNTCFGEGDEVIILEDRSFDINPNVGIGGGGERTFTFRAVKIGTIELHLKLWQSWEGNNSVIERYNLIVRVLNS